ncbi:nitric oxide synthase oxygenase [Paenibacillus taiwanensis]|uniref:nitric oxide synthase oxygenase n=1 Tax=Paenibacillus taiwanensis TaxID=401638 RepID=UPI00048C4B55|nr:nitric oxide synthase oxygenase [Paenibacillus taiwanensis]
MPDKAASLYRHAEPFIRACHSELLLAADYTEQRLAEIRASIDDTGTYEHTNEELIHGAKMAWRNSNRCIGRLFWNTLHVVDKRHATTADEYFEALLEHIRYATNGGQIRPTITIFKSYQAHEDGWQICNDQLIRYAGYKMADHVIGDPVSVELTALCQRLGWQSQGGAFDLLPLVIRWGQDEPVWRNIPKQDVLEVPLVHPEYTWFGTFNWKWYAVPIVSNMRLEIGGLCYEAAPFNGWYMGTEIGARNLADEARYNLLPVVAEQMGLSTHSNINLWKDRALVELNTAVLHSYRQAGVSIVDHHTAARQFMQFEQRELTEGRTITGDWTWLIPPMSPAATSIFHQSYDNTWNTPNFFYKN